MRNESSWFFIVMLPFAFPRTWPVAPPSILRAGCAKLASSNNKRCSKQPSLALNPACRKKQQHLSYTCLVGNGWGVDPHST